MTASAPCGDNFYVIALGSNRCHGRFGRPEAILAAALAQLQECGVDIVRTSATIGSAPVGPSLRRYANSAAVVSTPLEPPALLALLKRIEREFGRRRGQRWGARVIDLDIILWSGGRYSDRHLGIPHLAWEGRRFVVDPVATIAGDWPVGQSALRARHVAARLHRPQPLPRDS